MGNSSVNLSSLARGSIRQFSIPSVVLTSDDLRRLYRLLGNRAGEASEYEVAGWKQLQEQSAEQFESAKVNAKALLRVAVTVQGTNGDWVGGPNEEPLSEGSLPDSLSRITFDSAFQFRSQFKIEPQNSFSVILDFSRTIITDLTNQAIMPESNQSTVRISGSKDGWVKAVHDDLKDFFKERSTPRGLLHRRFSYDFFLLVLGFPASLALCYHIAKWITPRVALPTSVAAPLYVALFLVSWLFFRFGFNYVKWIFPKVDGPNRRTWPGLHRGVLVLIGGALVSLIVESIVHILRASILGAQ